MDQSFQVPWTHTGHGFLFAIGVDKIGDMLLSWDARRLPVQAQISCGWGYYPCRTWSIQELHIPAEYSTDWLFYWWILWQIQHLSEREKWGSWLLMGCGELWKQSAICTHYATLLMTIFSSTFFLQVFWYLARSTLYKEFFLHSVLLPPPIRLLDFVL